MATRHAGEVRVRMNSPDGQKYVPYARTLLGMLKEKLRLGGVRTGKLTKTLDDGTVISAMFDGSLYIVNIEAEGGKTPCESFIPDIIGLATAITPADETPPSPSPDPPDLPVTKHISIVGWTVPRPAPDALLATLTGDTARAFWAAAGIRPEGADELPKFPYDKVSDACGNIYKLHENLLYGNFDWTDGRDVLTCWSGQRSGSLYLPGQRYGAPGISNTIYLRGRVLHTIPEDRVVNGIAFRTVDGVKYLMVVWKNRNNFSGGLQRLRVKWLANKPYPTVGEAEDVVTFDQRTAAMWCFNASGTEARRIAPNMVAATCEQILTDEGVEYLPSADLITEDTFAVVGTATSRQVWLPFTEQFYNESFPSTTVFSAVFPLLRPQGATYDELYDAYFKYGENVAASGTGARTEKLAVDYIGDTPEYLLSRIAGGATSVSDSPSTSLTRITDVETVTATAPGPHPCPSNVPNTVTTDVDKRNKLDAARNKNTVYTTATQSFLSTTYPSFTASRQSLNETAVAAATVLNEYTYYSVIDEMIVTDSSCYTSGSYIVSSSYEQSRNYRLDRSSAVNSTAESQFDTLFYVDLRYGVFVVHRTVGSVVSTLSNSLAVGIESGGYDVEDSAYRNYTDESTTTSAISTSGREELVVYHKGEPVYTHSYMVPPANNTSTSTSAPVGLSPEDHITTNYRRALPFIWEQFAGVHLTAIPGSSVPPDAYDYGGSVSNPDEENWYANSPYAVRADGEYTASGSGYVEQPPAYGWGYPLANARPAEFRQPVIYAPDNPGADPEDYTFLTQTPLVSISFSVVADDENVFVSMPLPTSGYSSAWTVVNVLPEWVYETTGATPEHRFYPMSLISPAFNT